MNTKKFAAAAAALLAISLAAQTRGQAKADPKGATAAVPMPKTDRIAMAEFKKLLATSDVVVIDVRSTDAYAGGHIPGALSIPEETLTPVIAEKLKRMGKPVATYCS